MSQITPTKNIPTDIILDSGYGSSKKRNPSTYLERINFLTSPPTALAHLGALEPSEDSLVLNPTAAYVAYLSNHQNYIFLSFRFGAICTALMRFDLTSSATKIAQFAIDIIGKGMFLTGLEYYERETEVGDDLVSLKYCLSDLIEDIEAYLDPVAAIKMGAELREVVGECGLTYDESEVPEVVEMDEIGEIESCNDANDEMFEN